MSVRHVSWIAIASMALASFALVTTELLPVGLLPEIARGTGVTEGEAGLTITVTGTLAGFAAPLSIAFVGKMDRRRLLLILLILLAASNIIVATASEMIQLLVGRMLLGVAVGGFWTIAGTLGPRLREGAAGIRANAVILSGVSIGTVAGVPAGAIVGHFLGWRAGFGAAALLATATLAVLFALLPPIPSKESTGLREIPEILRTPQAGVGLIASVLAFIGQFASYTYIAPFLSERAGVQGVTLSEVLLASGAAGFFGNVVGGWISGSSARASACIMALLLGCATLALEFSGQSAWLAIPLVIGWGFAFGMLPISTQSWMAKIAPDHLEGIQALFVGVTQWAIAGGALLGGVIVDRASIDAALLTSSAAAFATLIIAGFRHRGPTKPQPIETCPRAAS